MLEIGLELCKKIGGSTYIVGGAVRDFLLGKEIHDIDIATNVSIDDICNRFETYDIGKNKDFGIVIVKYKGIDFEVAHFRNDGVYSDGRHPDKVSIVNTVEEDLSRRDFTINAMAYDGKKIIDPFGGQDDIKKGKLRFVGNAEDRIKEDGLRVLRAYRFAGKYKLDIVDEEVMNGFDLSNISQERITQEIIKTANNGSKCLAFFLDRIHKNDIQLILELQYPLEHQKKHHPEGNVFSHIIHCLSAVDYEDYLTNLCIMFHDLGKLYVQEERDNKIIYYGHDLFGSEKIYEVGNRLKLSNKDIDVISYCCKYHMVFWDLEKMTRSKQLNIILNENFEYLSRTCEADELGRLYLADRGRFRRIQDFAQDIGRKYRNKQHLESRLKELFTAEDILELREDIVGRNIGVLKQKITEYIIEKEFDISRTEILSFITNYNV